MSAKSSAKTRAPLADSGAPKQMRSALLLCLPSKKKEEILLRTDYRRPASIPNNIGQKLSQNTRAACAFRGNKADPVCSSALPSLQ